MKSLSDFKKLCEEMAEVDAVIVYIAEAHPTDGWQINVPGQYQVKQPKKFEEKISCASHLADVLRDDFKFSPRIFVDKMEGGISSLFAAHPERLAVLLDGEVKFIGGKGPFDYSIDALRQFLRKQN